MAAWCVACLVYWLLGVVVLAVPAAGCVFAAVVSVPAGRCLLYSWLLGVLAACCCPCCCLVVSCWLLEGVVIGKGKNKNKINIPTQIISPPLIKGGGI